MQGFPGLFRFLWLLLGLSSQAGLPLPPSLRGEAAHGQGLNSTNSHPNPLPLDSAVLHPILWLWVGRQDYNFDIQWLNPDPINTAYFGYGTTLRVSGALANAIESEPVVMRSITLWPSKISLSSYSVLFVCKLTNSDPTPKTCDVAIWADVSIGSNDYHVTGALPGGVGFYWAGDYLSASYQMNVIFGGSPLLSQATAYWFGPTGDMFNEIWSQTTESVITVGDVAMSFSWQNVSVPVTSYVSVLFPSGAASGDPPTVNVNGQLSAPVSGSLSVEVSVSRTTSLVKIFVVADGHVWDIICAAENLTVGLHPISINLSPFGLSLGGHLLDFFAVDEVGFISDAANFSITTIQDPTPTVTRSPPPSQTPAPYPSPYPRLHPIIWYWVVRACFDVIWRNGDVYVYSTFDGYRTVLRVGSEFIDLYGDSPQNLSSITIRPTIVTLSSYSILIIFRLTNSAAMSVAADLAICADAIIGDNERHSIAALPDGQGLYWSGLWAGSDYRMNLVGRYYPLVSDITAFWFGYYVDLDNNLWRQVNATGLAGFDVAFSSS
jgi:hypothetical protein